MGAFSKCPYKYVVLSLTTFSMLLILTEFFFIYSAVDLKVNINSTLIA